ncbi:hypothetical protein ABZZ04_33665 [Streptomyces sp. NPDC006435]|uniref:hypothetical protein n=1 Tax=Streptomyces sp. NPDC006435 TaxID=3154300 RepID=UPI0033A6F63F
MAGKEGRSVERERSGEESEPVGGRGEAVDAPSEPSSRTSTESGTDTTTGGGARTPIVSESGPEEPDEPDEPAEKTAAVVHAVGVSIGRNTSDSEQPDGDDAAAAAVTAAQEEAPAPRKAARPSTASVAVGAPATSSDTAKAESGPEAEAATPSASTSTEPATTSASATAEQTAMAASTATASASASASTAASSVPPAEGSAETGDAPERPGRISRPMVVAAAFAGALLLATPFIVAGAQQDEPDRKTKEAAAAWKDDGSSGGYVPGTDPDRAQGKGPTGSKDREGAARHGKGPAGDVRTDTGTGGKPVNDSTDTKADGAKDTGNTKSTGGGTDRTSNSGTGGSSSGDKDSGTSAKAPSTGTAPKSTTTVVYSGVSGPECDTQRFQQYGYYTDGKEGWATHSGGYGGSGCDGKYLSMPMSGSSSKDSGGSATWLFDLPSTAKKCSVSVHVPGSSNIVQVGGNPSYYTVYDRFLPRTSNLVGSFTIRQTERRGTWYNVPGTFPVEAMKLSVRLHDRGEDDHYEHHAISAVKATCTG